MKPLEGTALLVAAVMVVAMRRFLFVACMGLCLLLQSHYLGTVAVVGVVIFFLSAVAVPLPLVLQPVGFRRGRNLH